MVVFCQDREFWTEEQICCGEEKGKEDNWFGFLHGKFEDLGLGCQTAMGHVNKFMWENSLSPSVSWLLVPFFSSKIISSGSSSLQVEVISLVAEDSAALPSKIIIL